MTFNFVTSATLRDPLDGDTLARAVDALVERHAILRTAHRTKADRTEQVVVPHAGDALQRHVARPDGGGLAARLALWRRCRDGDVEIGERQAAKARLDRWQVRGRVRTF